MMLTVNCVQGSPEWAAARLGIPTASEFGRILTPTGKLSTQADAYALQLCAEWLMGRPVEGYKSAWMERGTELEPEARAYYELNADVDVQQVGFVYSDERRLIGCSPDGLVGRGGLEIKVPAPHTHLGYLLNSRLPNDYIPQVQGGMLVTGAEWWDWMSYHPDLPPVIIRVQRDEVYINALGIALESFLSTLRDKRNQLLERGLTPRPPILESSDDVAAEQAASV